MYIGPTYSDISEINGPSGWYKINTPKGPTIVYVDQTYDGGGWVMVMANRRSTGGLNNLTYNNAVNSVNYRTGGTNNGSNTVVPLERNIKNLNLDNLNCFMGLDYWQYFGGRASTNNITVVQFVSPSITSLSDTANHTKRYRWRFTGFSSVYVIQGYASVSDETSTGAPGFYASAAASGRGLTTFDNDQDTNAGNCSTYYNNNPWWYTSCWSGNYFAGGGYQDAPYWTGATTDHHNYGAVYIK